MPVLSSFISYRPGRTKAKPTKSDKSPFAIRQFDSSASPHPYASHSSRVLDINDSGVLAPNRGRVDGSSRDHYREHHTNVSHNMNGSNVSPSPHVELSLEINREPWFPTSMLKSDSSLDRESTKASGSGAQFQYGRDTAGDSRLNGMAGSQESSSVEEDEEQGGDGEVDLSSAEDVLADLEAMDVCNISLFYFCSLSLRPGLNFREPPRP